MKPSNLQPLHDQMETMFNKMKISVKEKYGERPHEFIIEFNNQSSKRRGNIFEHVDTNNAINARSSVESNLSHSIDYDSFNDSLTTPLSQAKKISQSMFSGISRRKSNASSMVRNDETRGSINSHHQRSVLNTTLESCPDHESSMINNNAGGLSTILVTENNSRLNAPTNNSRPNSTGHQIILTTSTPNHSRSPSMQSNRDSLISCTEENPPQLPPKPSKSSFDYADTLSLSNLSNHSGSREDIIRRKKAPPPPPPIICSENGSSGTGGDVTPPTPPRKPPLRDP